MADVRSSRAIRHSGSWHHTVSVSVGVLATRLACHSPEATVITVWSCGSHMMPCTVPIDAAATVAAAQQ